MAKHFGMDIYGWAMDSVDHCDAVARAREPSPPSQAYWIDKKSLHLLEPQEADTIVYQNGSYHGIVGLSIGAERAKKNIANGAKIIRRGHIPFMWPESEAA
jgi:hypothetical protein